MRPSEPKPGSPRWSSECIDMPGDLEMAPRAYWKGTLSEAKQSHRKRGCLWIASLRSQ
jgi:hypothetical protein